MRTRVQNALHTTAMGNGLHRAHKLWNREGQALLGALSLPPHTAQRRSDGSPIAESSRAHRRRI
jgi:hypothetical protein